MASITLGFNSDQNIDSFYLFCVAEEMALQRSVLSVCDINRVATSF